MTEGRTLGRTTGIRIAPENLGRYADCFMDARTGLWYASVDADPRSPYSLRPRRGALPRPEQDTPALTARVYGIHQRAARRLMLKHLQPRPKTIAGRIAAFLNERLDALFP